VNRGTERGAEVAAARGVTERLKAGRQDTALMAEMRATERQAAEELPREKAAAR
jgi:hypothetical protein